MDFHSRSIHLSLDSEQIKKVLQDGLHHPFINGHNDFFKPMAVYLNWTKSPNGGLEGRISYLRHKNLCIFRIFTTIEQTKQGSLLTLTGGHGPWSKQLMNLSWVFGFMLCVVGAIIPWYQTRYINKQLKTMIESTCNALEQMSSEHI
ncbi:MAG: hypothetical protein CMK59_15000 [Proteobacteria bacterium]|nr:hypothetical protein [Pseudomonadota bacterium]